MIFFEFLKIKSYGIEVIEVSREILWIIFDLDLLTVQCLVM